MDMGGWRRGRGVGRARVRFRRRVEVPRRRGEEWCVVEGSIEVSGGRGSWGMELRRWLRIGACFWEDMD